MEHHLSQHRQEQQQDQPLDQQQQSVQQPGKEFATPEELLRYDAAQVEVPPAVADRVQRSLDRNPPPPRQRSWWDRLFKR